MDTTVSSIFVTPLSVSALEPARLLLDERAGVTSLLDSSLNERSDWLVVCVVSTTSLFVGYVDTRMTSEKSESRNSLLELRATTCTSYFLNKGNK